MVSRIEGGSSGFPMIVVGGSAGVIFGMRVWLTSRGGDSEDSGDQIIPFVGDFSADTRLSLHRRFPERRLRGYDSRIRIRGRSLSIPGGSVTSTGSNTAKPERHHSNSFPLHRLNYKHVSRDLPRLSKTFHDIQNLSQHRHITDYQPADRPMPPTNCSRPTRGPQ